MSKDQEHADDPDFITPEQLDEPGNGPADSSGPAVMLASQELPAQLFLLPAGSKPVFPGMIVPLVLPPGPEADLVKHVVENLPSRMLGFVLVRQDESPDDEVSKLQFHRVGTVARILKTQVNSEGMVQALLQGQRRFRIVSAIQQDQRLRATVVYPDEPMENSDEVKALGLAILNSIRSLMKLNSLFSEEMKMALARADWGDPGRLADFATTMTSASSEEQQEVLECFEVHPRLNKVLFLLRKELDINELKEKITHQIEERISKQQREFFLREQLKVIKQELGLEKDEKDEEVEKHQKRLAQLKLPEEAKKRIEEEIDKLRLLPAQSPEYGVSKNYLDWLTVLPWGEATTDLLDVARTREILDRDHYGLDDVKKRILEFVGVAKLKGTVDGSILCLVGPPGVGKTSIGRAVAEALGRKFYRFSLGGMRDEAEIKGHRRTYIGAMPGKFIQAIKTCGSCNPVIMLDEIDKVGVSYQGDPASALLEVLDPEQNSSFRDHYLDVPFDLSKVLFIATANVPDTIPPPLFDRMEVIRLSGYIMDEKMVIARRHLIPRSLPRNGLTAKQIAFTDAAIRVLADSYAREAGVRNLEKAINRCMRKVASGIAEGTVKRKVTVTPEKLPELVGKPLFEDDPLMKERRAGVVMGLAWTAFGGSTLYIEAAAMPGKGGFKITGQIGNVMNESSQIAWSVLAANAKKYNLPKKFFDNQVVHIHIPAGATPKDGPSAGITMATALVSLGIGKAPPARLAMTGELTLTGRVLPVGGIKEKIIAARRSGVRDVILPEFNRKDFDEIPENVREGITPHFVESFEEVYRLVFGVGLQR